MIAAHEGYVAFRGYRTWYRVHAELDAKQPRPAIVALHGGPGVPHQSVELLAGLADEERAVVLYDQLGCGASDRPDDPNIFSVRLFIDELDTLRQALQLEDVHLIGHSWGGMLAMEYALRQPRGLRSITLLGAPAARRTFMAGQARLRQTLPPAVRDALQRHEQVGEYEHPDYLAGRRVWDEQFVCRITPRPAFYDQSYADTNLDLNVGMWTGELSDWDIRPRLDQISVPTLIIAGAFDGQVPGEHHHLHAGIKHARLSVFEHSAHYPHAEEPERFRAEVLAFLAATE
jgi:proline-specific peptidase